MIKKNLVIGLGIITLLIVIYSLSPYSNNLRKHYSSIYESRGDSAMLNSKGSALLNYYRARLLFGSEELSYKIGSIYLSDKNTKAAEKEFNSITDISLLPRISNQFLLLGKVELSEKYLDNIPANEDIMYIRAILSTVGEQSYFDCANFKRCDSYMNKLTLITKNTNNPYKHTAIAILLYNEGYESLAYSMLIDKDQKNYAPYWQTLAKVEYNNAIYKKSAIALNNAIKLEPYDLESYKLLTRIKEKQGEKKDRLVLDNKIKTLSTEYLKY